MKRSSSSIKSTGDKNVTPGTAKMSPQDRAERFVGGRAKVEKMWGKVPLLTIVDDSLSDFAFRVHALFAVPTLQGGAIALSYKEIAKTMSCSERQVQRAIHELEAHGYIKVSRRHNCRNSYSLSTASHVDDAIVTVHRTSALTRCAECKKRRMCDARTGWCKGCIRNVELNLTIDRRVDKKLDERGIVRDEMARVAS
jgi:biotin operon repressor